MKTSQCNHSARARFLLQAPAAGCPAITCLPDSTNHPRIILKWNNALWAQTAALSSCWLHQTADFLPSCSRKTYVIALFARIPDHPINCWGLLMNLYYDTDRGCKNPCTSLRFHEIDGETEEEVIALPAPKGQLQCDLPLPFSRQQERYCTLFNRGKKKIQVCIFLIPKKEVCRHPWPMWYLLGDKPLIGCNMFISLRCCWKQMPSLFQYLKTLCHVTWKLHVAPGRVPCTDVPFTKNYIFTHSNASHLIQSWVNMIFHLTRSQS